MRGLAHAAGDQGFNPSLEILRRSGGDGGLEEAGFNPSLEIPLGEAEERGVLKPARVSILLLRFTMPAEEDSDFPVIRFQSFS